MYIHILNKCAKAADSALPASIPSTSVASRLPMRAPLATGGTPQTTRAEPGSESFSVLVSRQEEAAPSEPGAPSAPARRKSSSTCAHSSRTPQRGSREGRENENKNRDVSRDPRNHVRRTGATTGPCLIPQPCAFPCLLLPLLSTSSLCPPAPASASRPSPQRQVRRNWKRKTQEEMRKESRRSVTQVRCQKVLE